MVHYHANIKNFGSPNGLCSSITESKHITAVKQPWHHSNRYNALSQILKVNERLDKLTAARADFAACGMLQDPPLVAAILGALNDNNDTHEGIEGDNSGNSDGINDDGNGDSGGGDNDSDAGPVESEPLMNEVWLACDKGK